TSSQRVSTMICYSVSALSSLFLLFFFTHPPPTEIYTLSLHDALPISPEVPEAWRKDSERCIAPRSPGYRENTSRASNRGRSQCSDRKSTRLNSSHVAISYAVFCLKKKTKKKQYFKKAL